jgi:hypothetical protein
MQIIRQMADYVTGSGTSEAVAAGEASLGREALVPLLNQLLGCLRMPSVLLPIDLQDAEAIRSKLEVLLGCCPELGAIFTLRGQELSLADGLDTQEFGAVVAMLRSRLGPPSVIV